MKRNARLIFAVLLLALCGALTGCHGPEVAGKSDRPWSNPRSWEHGLPSGLNEGR